MSGYEWDPVKMAWLRRYREAVARIDDRMEEIMRLRQMLQPGSQKLSDMPGGGGRSDWTDTVATIIEMEATVKVECDEFKRVRDEIVNAINAVNDDRYRTMLDKRYIGCKTWERIAEEMYCDTTTLWRWHGAALEGLVIPNAD